MKTINLSGIELFTILDNYDLSLGNKEVTVLFNASKYGIQFYWSGLSALNGTITLKQSIDDDHYDFITYPDGALITLPLNAITDSGTIEDTIGTTAPYIKIIITVGTNTTGLLSINFKSLK